MLGERGEVHVHVERDAVIAAAAPHAKAERRDLRAQDVDTGRAGFSLGPDAVLSQRIDHRAFE